MHCRHTHTHTYTHTHKHTHTHTYRHKHTHTHIHTHIHTHTARRSRAIRSHSQVRASDDELGNNRLHTRARLGSGGRHVPTRAIGCSHCGRTRADTWRRDGREQEGPRQKGQQSASRGRRQSRSVRQIMSLFLQFSFFLPLSLPLSLSPDLSPSLSPDLSLPLSPSRGFCEISQL